MKTKFFPSILLSAIAAAAALPLTGMAANSTPASAGTPSTSPSDDRLQQLDDQLDSVFSNTFRGFGSWFDNSALGSIDLRSQKDKYVVRVYVPGPDSSHVNARVDGNVLHVTAQGAQNTQGVSQQERFEQIVSLPGPVDSGKMQIERKPHLVVISLPKTGPANPAAGANPPQSSNNVAAMDQSVVDQIARMQRRMDQLFQDAFPPDTVADQDAFPDMGSAVHLENKKNSYVVHFYLPDQNLQNVQVKLENGELRLTASDSSKQQNGQAANSEAEDFQQIMTLPGPVVEKGMQVERKNGTIVVTVPKKA